MGEVGCLLRRPDVRTPFFLSYAHTGPKSDEMAQRFYNILCGDLQTLVAVPVGTAMGFFDREGIESAMLWDEELADALGTCQVLVPLICPPYLEREWCGKEWHAFTQRDKSPLPGAASSPNLNPILPVWWAPVPFTLPPEARRPQYFAPTNTREQPDLARLYEEEGLFHLLQSSNEETSQKIIWQLAKRIQQMYYSQRLEPKEFAQSDLRNIFEGDAP